MLRDLRTQGLGDLVAFLATLGTALACYGLSNGLSLEMPFILFVLPVFLSAWYGGWRSGLLATLLCCVAGLFLLIERESGQIANPSDRFRLILLAMIGIAISWITEAMHQARQQAQAEYQRLQQEVSERRRAEAALRERENFLEFALECGSMVAWDRNLDTGESIRSKNSQAVLGITSGSPKMFFDLIHPQDREKVEAELSKTIQGEAPFDCEFRYIRPDGRMLWIKAKAQRRINPENGQAHVIGVSVDITEQKRIAAELHRQSSLLKTITDNAPSMLFMVNREGRVTFVNPAVERLTGYSEEELIGCVLPEKLHHSHPDGTLYPIEECPLDQSMPGLTPLRELEEMFVREDGSFFPVSCSASPIYSDGEPIGTVFEIQDISDRKQQEKALRASEERHRKIFESTGDAILIFNENGCLAEVNPAACQMHGYTRDELIGMHGTQLIHPDDHHKFSRFTRQVGADERFHVESTHIRKDGSQVFVEVHGAMFQYTDQTHLLAIVRDVTERKLAEDQIRFQAHMLDAVGQAAIATDLEGKIIYWNRFAETLYGWTRTEAIGRNIVDVVVSPEQAKQAVDIFESMHSGQSWTGEFLVKRRDGTSFPAFVTDSPIFDEQGNLKAIVGISQDLTSQKQVEEALRAADRRKDNFLATLAHELRNPLAPIRNALELMKLAGADQKAIEEARCLMERQVRHMVRLIDDLLDVSRITRDKLELRKERIDLAAAVQAALEVTQARIDSKALELVVKLPPEPIEFDADLTRLTQIFTNLLDNAAKYSEPGGRIWLTADRQGNDLLLKVRDEGIGIAAEHLPSLFQMFSQVAPALERSQGGLGIGLALVKGLVELHGGQVEAHSQGIGKGSEFLVRLPILIESQTPHRVVEMNAVSIAPFKSPSHRILVVDDMRESAGTLSQLLRLMGHEIRMAYDGQEAIEVAEHFLPELILMDIGMPRINGYDAAQLIRQHPWGRDIFLVALTGWGQEEDKQRSLEAGFDRHLTKPIDLHILSSLIAELAESPIA